MAEPREIIPFGEFARQRYLTGRASCTESAEPGPAEANRLWTILSVLQDQRESLINEGGFDEEVGQLEGVIEQLSAKCAALMRTDPAESGEDTAENPPPATIPLKS